VDCDRLVRGLLDAQAESLDAATLDRLGRARRAALAEAGTGRASPVVGWLAGAALAGLAAVMLWPETNAVPVPPAPVSMESFGMLASPEEVEPLDFYLWAETQDAGSDDHAG
jgi:hypothetical protein